LVAAWRTEVVAPLRAVRRAMKLSPLLVEAPVGALRQAVAAQELAAEQLQQAMLHRWAMARWPLVTPGDAGLAGANLALLTAAPEVAVLSAP
jgi:hypothetical protein